jgi:predicted phosphodiesterase
MEVAVIADVHSNLSALEAVLAEVGDLPVYSCGDVVGYNPFPNETINLFRRRGITGVMGNHDYAVVKGDVSKLNTMAATVAKWTRDVLTKRNLEYLASLPESYSGKGFTIYHGSPRNRLLEYVFPVYPLEKLDFSSLDSDVLVLGHTHVPFVRNLKSGLVFNPGSTGQPRDSDPRAPYAILDAEKKEVALKRVAYDIDRVAEEIRKKDLPKSLAERLYRGE